MSHQTEQYDRERKWPLGPVCKRLLNADFVFVLIPANLTLPPRPQSQVRIAKSSAPPSQSAFSSQGHSSTGKKANWSWEGGSHRSAACAGHAHQASGSLLQHLGSAAGSHPAFLARLLKSAKSAFQKLPLAPST